MLGVCILIIVHIELALGCPPGGGSYYGGGGGSSPPESAADVRIRQEALTKMGKDAFAGFEVPKDLTVRWIEFWMRYRKDEEKENSRNITDQEKYDDDRTPEKGWPHTWDDLNVGDSGVKEIPPWAWVPVNDQSLPTYCFLFLREGTSTGIGTEVCESQTRYAYNPFLKDCLPFTYLGCGGNTNNFVKKEDCIEQCMPHPSQGGCDPNVMQLMSTLSDLDEQWGEGN